MKHSHFQPAVLALVAASAMAFLVLNSQSFGASAATDAYRCTESSFYFPANGIVGWTYQDPDSTDLDASGSVTAHTGVDIFADGGDGSPIYAPADGFVSRQPGSDNVNLLLAGTNVANGEAGVEMYFSHLRHNLTEGDFFSAGDVIGIQIGDHVHFSVGAVIGYDDRQIDQTQDPSPYFHADLTYRGAVQERLPAPDACYTTEQSSEAVPISAPAEPTQLEHLVQEGDTLSAIAASYGVSIEAIVAANGMFNPDSLSLGQVLTIPVEGAASASPPVDTTETQQAAATGPQTYVVQEGDTLGAIAAAYGLTVEAIVAANDMLDPDNLSLGQELIIPVEGDSAISAPPAQTLETQAAPATGPQTYVVQDGDTLSSIAAAFGTDIETIIQLNALTDPDALAIGDTLIVP